MRSLRTPLRIGALVLALFIMAATYATPMVLAHALGASSVRIVVFLDDERREPTSTYFLSVSLWGISVRVEWIGVSTVREGCSRT